MNDPFVLYWIFRYNFVALLLCVFAVVLAAAYMLKSWRVFAAGVVILSLLLGAKVMFEVTMHDSALGYDNLSHIYYPVTSTMRNQRFREFCFDEQ